MSGPCYFAKSKELADKFETKGLEAIRYGVEGVGQDGHVRLTLRGLPERWDGVVGAMAACEGIPTEHLQPGAVKALVDALEAEFKIDAHMATCQICTHMGFCEDGEAMSDAATALKQKALAPFRAAQTTYYGTAGLDSIKQFGAE